MNLDSYLTHKKLVKCQKAISYQFKNPLLLLEALWHISQKNHSEFRHKNFMESLSQLTTNQYLDFSYDRMEFVGDSLLGYYVSERLYKLFPDFQEGLLTKAKQNIVSAKSLGTVGKKLNLQKFVFVFPENLKVSESIISDVYESLIAAIYFDGGFEAATNFIEKTTEELFTTPLETIINHKAILSEWAAKNQLALPIYEVTDVLGPEHKRKFKMKLKVNGKSYGPITGNSKKEAEQKVARIAIKKLNIVS